MFRSLVVVSLILSLRFDAWADARSSDQFDPDRGIIFTAEQVAAQAAAAKRPIEIRNGWTPIDEDIARLDLVLAPALAAEIARHAHAGDRPLNPVDYYRQYIGLTDHGVKLVVVNGFHRVFVENEKDRAPDFWKHQLTGAWDGGCMFFHAAFDPQTRTLKRVVCQRDLLQEDEPLPESHKP